MQIDICICTYQRSLLLQRLLTDLGKLEKASTFSYRIIVGDNDANESARPVVEAFAAESQVPIEYCVEPEQNIALMRNRVVALSSAELVALIDDDEFPGSNWLQLLQLTLEQAKTHGVLGPVLPHYSEETPQWFRKAGLYNFRKRYPTGTVLEWHECRTGNALLKREALQSVAGPFRAEFGTGGEDQDFFRRAIEQGKHFVWCDEAIVYEVIQPSRWNRRVLLSRALLRGKNTFQHRPKRWSNIAKATCAVPIYCILLPFALLAGEHRVMSLLTRVTSHIGLLLAAFGLNPQKHRTS